MDNNSLNKKSIGNNKKTKSQEKVQDQNIKNVLYFLSDKKNNAPLSIIKSFLYTKENNELSNDTKTKKVIKVNTDNYCKTKNKLIVPGNINNAQNIKKELNENDMKTDDNMSINEKISKFETRIGNLLDVIDNFEKKFINSPETQRIKDQFKVIMDKKIYKNKRSNDYLHKSWLKTDFKDDLFENKDNTSVMRNSCIMDIKNINISINNNNYENNYFITQSTHNKNSPHRGKNKKQIYSEKKFNIKINNNNSIFKKSNLKTSNKKPKCISNDLKNKIYQNQKDKAKLIKIPLDFILNNNINNKNIKNNRYNKSHKEFQEPLTDRREKIKNNNIINIQNKKTKLKSANKKKQSCIIINKNIYGNNDIAKKPSIKKEGTTKSNLLNSKKNLFSQNLNPSTLKMNSAANTINSRRDYKDKKLINNFNIIKNKASSSNYINYAMNKKKIIKRNNVISFFNNQHETDNNTQNSH